MRHQSVVLSDDLRDAFAHAHRQGSSLTLLCGLTLRVPALRTALEDRRVDVDGLEADTAERLSWWQRRRRRRRDLHLLVGRAASDAMARGARCVDPSDVVRALGREPEVDAARRLRTVGIDAEQLRRIADEVDADGEP